jgi:hypothetical protein
MPRSPKRPPPSTANSKPLEDKLIREERELREDQKNCKPQNGNRLERSRSAGWHVRCWTQEEPFHFRIEIPHGTKRQGRSAESEEAIAQFKKEISQLIREREDMVREISDRWGHVVNDTDEVTINPKKTDIYVNLFGVAWKPFYVVQAGGETFELPAFGAE